MNNKKIRLFLCAAAMVFALSPESAKAENISVVFGEGFPISENNIAPGQTFSRSFFVTNISESDQSLMIRFDDQVGFWSSPELHVEDMIFVGIERPNGTQVTMPNNKTTESLKNLYELNDAFVFDTLAATDKIPNEYKIIFTFSRNAGNEYQNKKTVFDAAVGIDAEDATVGASSASSRSSGNGDNDDDNNNEDEDEDEDNPANTGEIFGISGASLLVEQSSDDGEEGENEDSEDTFLEKAETGEIAGAENEKKENDATTLPYAVAGVVLASFAGWYFMKRK